MTFEELVDQAIAMLERRGRVTYRALKRQFQLDDNVLEDLTAEIIKAQRLAVDEDGEVLVWMGTVASAGSSQRPPRSLCVPHTPTRPRTWPRKSSPPEPPWQASASRARCCLPT
jgi:hypothetical protein